MGSRAPAGSGAAPRGTLFSRKEERARRGKSAYIEFRRPAPFADHPSIGIQFRVVRTEEKIHPLSSVRCAQRRHSRYFACLPISPQIPPPRRFRPISVLHHAFTRFLALLLARPPARKISPACDTHFSRLTVVEGREITTARRKGPPSQYLSREEPFSCAPLARSLFLARRGWQKSRSGRLVISHFPKQRHRQAVALFLPHASLPPVPRRCLSLSLSLHGTHPLSSSFPLYSRSLSISSRSVYPSTGRSHYSLSLSLLLRFAAGFRAFLVPLAHTVSPHRPPFFPSYIPPSLRLRDSDSETQSGKSPLSGSVDCGFETFSLAPLAEEKRRRRCRARVRFLSRC